MDFTQLNAKFQASITAINAVLDGFGEVVADIKRVELRAGMDADGGRVSPEYQERYGVYKASLSTYYAPDGTPDFFVTGKTHKSIDAKRDGRIKKGAGYNLYLKKPPPYAKKVLGDRNEPSGISPQGEKDLDNKLRLQLEKELKKIWT